MSASVWFSLGGESGLVGEVVEGGLVFDTYCSEHHRTVFDKDTVEGWVSVQLEHSGRYRSWLSYIRDFGRWLNTNGANNAYVLSERWKARI